MSGSLTERRLRLFREEGRVGEIVLEEFWKELNRLWWNGDDRKRRDRDTLVAVVDKRFEDDGPRAAKALVTWLVEQKRVRRREVLRFLGTMPGRLAVKALLVRVLRRRVGKYHGNAAPGEHDEQWWRFEDTETAVAKQQEWEEVHGKWLDKGRVSGGSFVTTLFRK